jgi:hypothetical protein
VGDDGQADVVEVMPGDDRQPQRVRHALLRSPAVGCETEHRPDQLLELGRGADLAEEAGLGVAGVVELVRLSRLDCDHLAGASLDRLAANLEPDLAVEHLETLRLVGMDVCHATTAFG